MRLEDYIEIIISVLAFRISWILCFIDKKIEEFKLTKDK